MAKIITKNDYQKEVVESDIPVLLDFFATWCGPCKMLAPIIEELASEYEGKVKIFKVDVDNDPELAREFNVKNIPMVAFVKDNTFADVSIGFVPKEELVKLIEANK